MTTPLDVFITDDPIDDWSVVALGAKPAPPNAPYLFSFRIFGDGIKSANLIFEKAGHRYDRDYVWMEAAGTQIAFEHVTTMRQLAQLYELWAGRPITQYLNQGGETK
ncbi:MAG: hypothetical protein KAZ26_20025 [Caldilineaceae bacterium]|nr:hypothetical protein [Caldilineaceae bacterium]